MTCQRALSDKLALLYMYGVCYNEFLLLLMFHVNDINQSINHSINHLLLTIQRINVNVTQHNMSRTERLKTLTAALKKRKYIY